MVHPRGPERRTGASRTPASLTGTCGARTVLPMRGSLLPRGEGRTFWGIAGDMFFFGVGASLCSQTTVIPSFLATLTTSAPLIGLASTISTGGWLLPQLFAANRLAGLTRRKKAVTVPAAINRSLALLTG